MKYRKELHDTLVKSKYYDSHIINALLDEIDRLNADRRWIPVSERLPETKGYYLTASPDNSILIDYFTGGTDKFNMFVTHWMPLPERPESEE